MTNSSMTDEARGDGMQLVHDNMAPYAQAMIEASMPVEHVADGFTMLALRLMSQVYGREQTAKMLVQVGVTMQAAAAAGAEGDLSFYKPYN